jgi:hypothetical protein
MTQFRFERLEIWKMNIEISDQLFGITDDLEQRRLFRFSEVLRMLGI